MKILTSTPRTVSYHIVTTDDGSQYERYSPDDWRWIIGESTETIFNPEKLEAAFQALPD